MPQEALPLWVWIEYPSGQMPRYISLNLIALSIHAPPAFRVVVLNRSNFEQYVPDMPAEFGRIPYAVAASDFARIALLALHGGLYMDADFLVQKPLQPIRNLLDRFESVSYESHGQSCADGHFSPNFVASRPRSRLWLGAWQSLRKQLKRPCGPPHRYKICCFAKNGTGIPCRVPWALTDAVTRPVSVSLAKQRQLSLYCYSNRESFTPWADVRPNHCMKTFLMVALRLRGPSQSDPPSRNEVDGGSAVGKPSAAGDGARSRAGWHGARTQAGQHGLPTRTDASAIVPPRLHPRRRANGSSALLGAPRTNSTPLYQCPWISCTRAGGDLRCGNSVSHNFFERITYHMFESVNGRMLAMHPLIEKSDVVVGELYADALRGAKTLPPPFAVRQRVQVRGAIGNQDPFSGTDVWGA